MNMRTNMWKWRSCRKYFSVNSTNGVRLSGLTMSYWKRQGLMFMPLYLTGNLDINGSGEGKFDILIMRHDLPDNQKATCLSEFLDHPDMRIVRDNLSENKSYHDCYREFQKAIRLSPEYVEEMLESKYARHFFPDEERELLRRRWLRLDDTRAERQKLTRTPCGVCLAINQTHILPVTITNAIRRRSALDP
ncbi:MAG: putative capsular polysaccharide synthesis family protein [Chromatiales bacterium]|nr:putative capsular polysaccharide synthesis family protein [Chromatiales bacterium]